MKKLFVMILALAALTACEKPFAEQEEVREEGANVTIRVTALEQIPFETTTRAAEPIDQLCSHLQFVLYNGDTKVKTVSQSATDSGFGNVSMALSEGTYQLVVLAHSCDGVATISSPEKITFPNNRVSDTFYYYGTLTVGSEPQTYDLQLSRCVAMFRLIITDDIPSDVSSFKFYYTGGSSTFSATAGYGCVNSRQTVTLTASASQKTYEVYTLPKAETGTLKMTVTALDASGNTVAEQVFEDVPVTVNQITQYQGAFFSSGGGSADSKSSWNLTADGEWASESEYAY